MIPVVAWAGVLANTTLGSGGTGGFGCGCSGGLGTGSPGAGGSRTLAGSPDDAPPLVVTAILLLSCLVAQRKRVTFIVCLVLILSNDNDGL